VPEEPAFDGEYKELHARWRRERIRQEEIFEANREEILAAHPGKHIAVCEGSAREKSLWRTLSQSWIRR